MLDAIGAEDIEDLFDIRSCSVNLVDRLRPRDDRISTTGYPQQRVFDICTRNSIRSATILLILDEIDQSAATTRSCTRCPQPVNG
ncbi:hypothetical protein C8039_08365 [Halogeometricum sp. wsp3]|nr:hypothetical protein C8039_08365 [Halogeometricum sp. wsp3]